MFCGALRIAATVLSILATQSMVPIAIPVCNRSRTGCEPSQMPVVNRTDPVSGSGSFPGHVSLIRRRAFRRSA